MPQTDTKKRTIMEEANAKDMTVQPTLNTQQPNLQKQGGPVKR